MAQTQGAILLRQIRQLVAAQCPSQQPDRLLLQNFIADHEEAAFAALVQRHGSMVLAVCRSVLHHQQDAEDVFQAAFLVLARKAHTIRKQQAVSSWLHGVAYRLALKVKAQLNRRRAREMPADDQLPANNLEDLSWRELRVVLHEELQRLPEKYRTPLLLCYWEGKTRDEAADQLGLTEGAFKKRLERARKLLGSRLTRRGLVPSATVFAALLLENGAKAAVGSFLTNSTAKAAVAFAAGKGTTGAVAARTVTLAEGAIRAMQLTTWTKTVLVALFLLVLATGLGFMTHQVLQAMHPAVPIKAAPAELPQPAVVQGKEAAGKKTDAERILGTWRITKGRVEGQDLPAEFAMVARLTFTKDGKAILNLLVEGKEFKYKLAGAGQIDLTQGADDKFSAGIYKFEGDDRLTLCVNNLQTSNKRPTEFSAEKGERQVLFVLVRAKPDEKLTPEELAKYKEAIEKVRQAAARAQSANNLKQIGIAMHNYYTNYKALPLHAIYSQDGKTALLSWRVAILPYIDEQALYNEFKLDEPWDSPHNKKLIPRMPKTYDSPAVPEKTSKEGKTFYQVFTGPDTVFDGNKKMTFQQITDGNSNTILAIEAKDPVIWSKPADLTLPKDKDKMPAVGGLFKTGINVLFCDASVHFFRPDPPPVMLRALVTPNGGEVVDVEKLQQKEN